MCLVRGSAGRGPTEVWGPHRPGGEPHQRASRPRIRNGRGRLGAPEARGPQSRGRLEAARGFLSRSGTMVWIFGNRPGKLLKGKDLQPGAVRRLT